MKVLVFGINYYPEAIGIGKYSTEMCEWLAWRGHQVKIITGMPYYPNWRVFDSHRGRFWYTETINGVSVCRCPIYTPKMVSGLTRILHEVSFILSSLVFWASAFLRKYDVVICVAPPLQLGLMGIIYRALHRAFMLYHIQDLQLDAARQLGLIRDGLLVRVVERVERYILRKSDRVSTISVGMKKKISDKGVSVDKIYDFQNWTDTERFRPGSLNLKLRRQFGVPDGMKIVLYSGNLGEKQGVEVILEVAESLFDSEIFFVIIGEGALRRKMESEIVSRGLRNVSLHPIQPLELLPDILNLADLHLVIQKSAASDLVLPSKLSAILSVGGCAIVTAERGTTLHDLVVDNKIGIVVAPENPGLLRTAILEGVNRDLSEIRINARKYAVKNLDRRAVLRRFEEFLVKRVESDLTEGLVNH